METKYSIFEHTSCSPFFSCPDFCKNLIKVLAPSITLVSMSIWCLTSSTRSSIGNSPTLALCCFLEPELVFVSSTGVAAAACCSRRIAIRIISVFVLASSSICWASAINFVLSLLLRLVYIASMFSAPCLTLFSTASCFLSESSLVLLSWWSSLWLPLALSGECPSSHSTKT